jgi:thiamine-monophosphate kinase
MVGSESKLITLFTRVFTQEGPSAFAPDLSDDCAWLSTPEENMVVTTDALCEGVHFDRDWDRLTQIGAQAAIVNLSDIAASGATPVALVWSICTPSSWTLEDFEALSLGFASVCAQAGAQVVGGNICVRPGGLEVHVTAFGTPIDGGAQRSGAQVGDSIYVTGLLGERALGYLSPSSETRALRHRWRPHLSESSRLMKWGHVRAMMDLSDGLLLDGARLAQASAVRLHFFEDALPVSDLCRALSPDLSAAWSGGEDYILLFTAPEDQSPPPEIGAVRIGWVDASTRDGDDLLMIDGVSVAPEGYEHNVLLHAHSSQTSASHNRKAHI